MRVLHLIKGLGPGGAEQLLVTHLQLHDRTRFETEVCYLVPAKNHNQAKCEAAGASVTCLGARRSADARWVLRLWRHLARTNYDVVHVHSPLVAAAARVWYRAVAPLLRRGPRPSLVYTEHNRWPRHDRMTRFANRATFGLDDVQVAVAQDVRQSIPARHRHRVEVLTHGIDLDAVRNEAAHRAAARAALGAAADDVVVGIVANFRREKRHDRWLAAAATAHAREPRLRFVAVGQGRLEDDVRAAAAVSDAAERVQFLGYRSDATRVMAGFDIFTLTSDHEGKPVALMEAMALGLPTVATGAGGIAEMLRPGIDGFVVAPEPQALADGYVSLARNEALRQEIGAAAARHAAQFDARAATERLEQIYDDLRASSSR